MKRIGRFEVAAPHLANIEMMTAIQKDMCILEIREKVGEGVTEFKAAGPMFDPVEVGESIPLYRLEVVSFQDSGEVKYRVINVERKPEEHQPEEDGLSIIGRFLFTGGFMRAESAPFHDRSEPDGRGVEVLDGDPYLRVDTLKIERETGRLTCISKGGTQAVVLIDSMTQSANGDLEMTLREDLLVDLS